MRIGFPRYRLGKTGFSTFRPALLLISFAVYTHLQPIDSINATDTVSPFEMMRRPINDVGDDG